MASYNKIILIGRLTRDPELRSTGNGTEVTNFAIAVDRRAGKDETKVTDFFDCAAWKQTARFVNDYIKKGNLVQVEGTLEINEGKSKEGHKANYIKVNCQSVQNLTSRADREEGDGGGGYERAPAPNADKGYQRRPAPVRKATPAVDDDFDTDPFADG